MDDSQRARQLVDEMLELIEVDMRTGDDTEWLSRIEAVIQRHDGSFEELVRLLSKWAAYVTMALANETKTPTMDDALLGARLVLMQWIEESP